MASGTASGSDDGGDVEVEAQSESERVETVKEAAPSPPSVAVSGSESVSKRTANGNEQTESENVCYFENGPFLRDFEIGGFVAEMLTDCGAAAGLEAVRGLNALCSRLREMISTKNSDDETRSALSLDEETVTDLLSSNERIAEHLHSLLCSIGLSLDAPNRRYVAAKCPILIDGGICFMASKVDEFHVDFKKRRGAEMDAMPRPNGLGLDEDAASKLIDGDQGGDGRVDGGDIPIDGELDGHRRGHRHHHDPDDRVRAHRTMSSPSFSMENGGVAVGVEAGNKAASRCLSHCSCCPPASPQRATRMDYLGRSREHIISIDDLQNYPPPAPQRKLNRKYIESEGSVERRVRTSSTFNSSMVLRDAAIPTVVIQPAAFDFGAVRIGNVYRFTASITNHGHSQSRFQLSIASQSDPEHPVHIKAYHKMGAIAPGIAIAVQIELCSETLTGPYSNILTVKTKKHIFDVEVTAHFVKQSHRETPSQRVVCLGTKC